MNSSSCGKAFHWDDVTGMIEQRKQTMMNDSREIGNFHLSSISNFHLWNRYSHSKIMSDLIEAYIDIGAE